MGVASGCLDFAERLQGSRFMNQAINAQEDVAWYFVVRRVSCIIAAGVGQLVAQQICLSRNYFT